MFTKVFGTELETEVRWKEKSEPRREEKYRGRANTWRKNKSSLEVMIKIK